MEPDRRLFPISEEFATPDGHSYFRCGTLALDDPRRAAREDQWALADDSGFYPWHTKDGVLWVALEGLEFGARGITLAVEQDLQDRSDCDVSATRTPVTPAEALIVASRLHLVLTVRDPDSPRPERFRVVPADYYASLMTAVDELKEIEEP